MLRSEFDNLFKRYLLNEMTEEEYHVFFEHLEDVDKQSLEHLIEKYEGLIKNNTGVKILNKKSLMWEKHKLRLLESIKNNIDSDFARPKKFNYKQTVLPYLAAATVLLFCSIALYFYKIKPATEPYNEYGEVETIYPVDNLSQIVLNTGKTVSVGDADNEPFEDDNVLIIKNQEGDLELRYKEGAVDAGINTPNKVFTAKGGYTSLILPDGSRVVLNSKSSLEFPTVFDKNLREVKVKGEAYFEVKSNKNWPFIVHSDQQKIQVLGTTFNIRDYQDEREFATTLLEGSVRMSVNNSLVSKDIVLSPGEHAQGNTSDVLVRKVDTEQYTAWINKRFVYSDTPIVKVINDLERWYDVEFVYKDLDRRILINGNLSKEIPLNIILEALSKNTQMKFKIEGRRVKML